MMQIYLNAELLFTSTDVRVLAFVFLYYLLKTRSDRENINIRRIHWY
jgi:hypothetical protein